MSSNHKVKKYGRKRKYKDSSSESSSESSDESDVELMRRHFITRKHKKTKKLLDKARSLFKEIKEDGKTGQKPRENLVVVKRVRNLKEEQHWPELFQTNQKKIL